MPSLHLPSDSGVALGAADRTLRLLRTQERNIGFLQDQTSSHEHLRASSLFSGESSLRGRHGLLFPQGL